MLLGMTFLKATNLTIDWAKGTCKGKVEAETPEAHYKPLANYTVDAAQMKEELQKVNYSAKYTNLESESQSIVWCTTKATILAAEKAEQTIKPWRKLVPPEYHKYGKVFSE